MFGVGQEVLLDINRNYVAVSIKRSTCLDCEAEHSWVSPNRRTTISSVSNQRHLVKLSPSKTQLSPSKKLLCSILNRYNLDGSLSITLGCIALITTVSECAEAVTNFVSRFRDTRQDLIAVTRELMDLHTTLHILKDGTQGKTANQRPRDLRQRICSMIESCNSVLEEMKALIQKYDGAGIDCAAKWAISGKRDFEKVRSSLNAHKGALSLVVEATTLLMATKTTDQIKKISRDTALIKNYTMKIVEQLAKQDEILEQIAWIREIITQKSTEGSEKTHATDEYLDSMSNYAESVCSDSVSEEIAENMQILSLETHRDGSSRVNSVILGKGPELSLPLFYDELEPMTTVLGNSHRLVEPRQPPRDLKCVNKHLWSFYVQASGEEIIERMIIDLHPTFLPSAVIINRSPYRVTRIRWATSISTL